MKFKHIYNNMSKNIIITITFLIVVIVMSISTLSSITSIKYSYTEIKNIEKKLSRKIYKFTSINGIDVINLNSNDEFSNKILKKINDEFYFYIFSKQPIYLKAFNGSEKIINKINTFDDGNYLRDSVYLINDKFFEVNDIKLKEGRKFTKEDLMIDNLSKNKNLVPVILGSNYSKYLNLGDKIIIGNPEEKVEAEIIGFIEENTNINQLNDILSPNYINIDNYVLAPYNIRSSQTEVLKELLFGNGVLIFNEDYSMRDINSKLNSISNEVLKSLDIKVGFEELTELAKQENTYRFNLIILKIVSNVLICTLSLIILIILDILLIEKRKKEYGIHILCGGTKKDLYFSIIIEQAILTILPYFSVLIYLKYSNRLNISISISILSLIIIFSVIITVITISINNIYSTSISNLIKGDD